LKGIILACCVYLYGCSRTAIAQDIHFSQIHASPTQMNPSLTGLFNSQYRFIANYKNQWKTVTANYNTSYASLDGKVLYLRNRNFVSAGISAYSDQAGDLGFSKKQANLAVSVVKSLGSYWENYLSVGMEGGFINQSVDYSRLHVLDYESDPSFQAANSGFDFDLSAGLTWYFKNRRFLMYAGSAFYHINEPEIGFSQLNENHTLFRKYIFHAGGEFNAFEKRIMLMPSIAMMYQGPHREVNIGTFVRHKLHTMSDSQRKFFYYGCWFRWYYSFNYRSGADAVILSVRLDNNAFSYALSYDFTVSTLTNASRTAGSPELSIIYLMDVKKSSQVRQKHRSRKMTCPTF
jgi:type IX secretion system PorP/SprF family membrane protein